MWNSSPAMRGCRVEQAEMRGENQSRWAVTRKGFLLPVLPIGVQPITRWSTKRCPAETVWLLCKHSVKRSQAKGGPADIQGPAMLKVQWTTGSSFVCSETSSSSTSGLVPDYPCHNLHILIWALCPKYVLPQPVLIELVRVYFNYLFLCSSASVRQWTTQYQGSCLIHFYFQEPITWPSATEWMSRLSHSFKLHDVPLYGCTNGTVHPSSSEIRWTVRM